MSEQDAGPSNLTSLDRAIAALVVAALLFCPLAFGTVERWSEQVFITLACVIALLTAARLARGGIAVKFGPMVAAPLIGFPILVGLQLLPWQQLTGVISPGAIDVRTELLGGLLAESQFLPGATITLYAEETWRHLRLLLAVISIFVAARVVARSRRMVLVLLNGMCAAGAIVGAIALGHQALRLEKIFGVIAVPRNITRAAPFIHHSHFAQFMNLSIGAALALLFSAISNVNRERSPKRFGDWIDLAQQGELFRFILPIGTLLIAVAGVATSGSRGGVLAFAAAGMLTIIVAAKDRRTRGAAMVGLIAMVVGVASIVAFSSNLRGRIEPLREGELSGGERLTLLRGQVEIWRSFPLVGTGLGTFQWVFPRYDKTNPINLASHAENEYAQVMTETGAAGFALMILFIIAAWMAYARCMRAGGRRSIKALGLGFGLAAICVQSFLDFGQHLPANAAMTAVTIACLVAMAARREGSDDTDATATNSTDVPRFAAAAAACLGAALGFLSWQAFTCARAADFAAASNRIAGRLAGESWRGADEDFAAMRSHSAAAVALRPRDAQFIFENASADYFSIARNAEGRLPATADLAQVGLALDQFEQAMRWCPTYGAPYSMAGQISVAMGDASRGDLLLRRAVELAPHDGTTAWIEAQLAIRNGDDAAALRLLHRAAATSAVGDGEIVRALVADHNRADLALQFAQDDRHRLIVVSLALRDQGKTAESAAAAEAAFAAARKIADRPDAPAAILFEVGQLLRQRGDGAAALPYLRRAVVQRPTELAWRYALAQLAVELAEYPTAIEELSAVLRDRPDWPGAAEMMSKARHPPTTRPR